MHTIIIYLIVCIYVIAIFTVACKCESVGN